MATIEHLNPPCLKPCDKNGENRCGSCENCNWCIDKEENGNCVPSYRYTPKNCPYSFAPSPPSPRPPHHRPHHRRPHHRPRHRRPHYRPHYRPDRNVVNDDPSYKINALITIILIVIVLIILILIYYSI